MKNNRGFTLIEILIAASIGAMFISGLVLSTLLLLRTLDRFDSRLDSLESGRISMFRMVTDARNAKGIKSSSNESVLSLDLSADTISYDHYNGKVRRRVNASSSYLTEEGRISFVRFSYPAQKLVKIEIGLDKIGILTTECFVRN